MDEQAGQARSVDVDRVVDLARFRAARRASMFGPGDDPDDPPPASAAGHPRPEHLLDVSGKRVA